MTLQVDFWQLLLLMISALSSFVAAIWALSKLLLRQLKEQLRERFAAQEQLRSQGQKMWDERWSRIETGMREREREHLLLEARLPKEYVRREDHIRFETGMSGKLDALNAKMDLLADRQKIRD